MIRKCDNPNVFKDFNGETELYCIETYDENGVYGYVGIDFSMLKCAVIHFESLRFSHTILKSLMCDWEDVKKILIRNKIKTICATRVGTVESRKRWIRFIHHFGFKNITQQVTSIQEL